MPATITGAAVTGISAVPISVEVDLIPGLPHITVVGLPDTAVQEARERIRSAVRNAGFEYPLCRITINLSPADLRKEGSAFDLPIAMALLMSGYQVNNIFQQAIVVGELGLDGQTRPIRGAIAYAELAVTMKRTLVLPSANAAEAGCITGAKIVPVASLSELCGFAATGRLRAARPPTPKREESRSWNTWPAIRGQLIAKRAAVIAAAGGHNLLLIGPPGSGKTMIAEGIAELLPDLDQARAVEVMNIGSLAGLRRPTDPFPTRPPFRRPHHGSSVAALIGGGRIPRPGELTLAHHGVLFLDEFPEFTREHLEALRQPLEQGTVVVNRVAGSVEFPAAFTLVAAMNPCPCGYAGDRERSCQCAPFMIQRYRRKISGPLLDRFDLLVAFSRVPSSDLRLSNDDPREMVALAQRMARERNGNTVNALLRGRSLRTHAKLGPVQTAWLTGAVDRLRLSLRAHDRVIRVARTIADLSQSTEIQIEHLAEAVQFRPPAALDEFSRTTAG